MSIKKDRFNKHESVSTELGPSQKPGGLTQRRPVQDSVSGPSWWHGLFRRGSSHRRGHTPLGRKPLGAMLALSGVVLFGLFLVWHRRQPAPRPAEVEREVNAVRELDTYKAKHEAEKAEEQRRIREAIETNRATYTPLLQAGIRWTGKAFYKTDAARPVSLTILAFEGGGSLVRAEATAPGQFWHQQRIYEGSFVPERLNTPVVLRQVGLDRFEDGEKRGELLAASGGELSLFWNASKKEWQGKIGQERLELDHRESMSLPNRHHLIEQAFVPGAVYQGRSTGGWNNYQWRFEDLELVVAEVRGSDYVRAVLRQREEHPGEVAIFEGRLESAAAGGFGYILDLRETHFPRYNADYAEPIFSNAPPQAERHLQFKLSPDGNEIHGRLLGSPFRFDLKRTREKMVADLSTESFAKRIRTAVQPQRVWAGRLGQKSRTLQDALPVSLSFLAHDGDLITVELDTEHTVTRFRGRLQFDDKSVNAWFVRLERQNTQIVVPLPRGLFLPPALVEPTGTFDLTLCMGLDGTELFGRIEGQGRPYELLRLSPAQEKLTRDRAVQDRPSSRSTLSLKESKPPRKAKPSAAPISREQQAASLLHLATQMLEHDRQTGIKRLEALAEQYSDTKAAAKAVELLRYDPRPKRQSSKETN